MPTHDTATIQSTPATLGSLRSQARDLLNEFDAADGLASYYALHHDPRRTTLTLHQGTDRRVDGFLVQCMTGIDLFRPLVTLRLRGQGAAGPLIETALAAGRPYLLIVPEALVERLKPHLALGGAVTNHILRLDPSRYRPEINALVVRGTDPAGNPRAEIREGEDVAAAAGVNWRSALFAEVYVHVQPGRQRRGWGRALVNAVAGELIKLGVTPLYSAAASHAASLELADQVGFVDTGAREVVCEATRR